MTDAKGVPIRRLNPPELGSPPGYSQIVEVRASRIVFIAGQTALDRDGALVGKNDFAVQAEQVFRNLGIALEAVGCTASDLVKLTVFLRDMGQLAAYREARNRFFATVAACGARRHFGRGVETLWPGFFDRDRGRGCKRPVAPSRDRRRRERHAAPTRRSRAGQRRLPGTLPRVRRGHRFPRQPAPRPATPCSHPGTSVGAR
jgi:enamine deaminase RidA (YjgF/YER057c/UK114 family)